MRRTSDYRFGVVFLVILTSAIYQLAAPDWEWSRFVTLFLQGLALILALRAAHVRRWLHRIADVFVLLVLLAAIPVFGIGEVDESGPRVLTVLFVFLAPAAIITGLIRELREDRRVTFQTMLAGLCIYLLIGMGFAQLFGAIDSIEPPFFAAGKLGTDAEFLYYSFATITTTGYGDFVAATNLGRALSVTEALIGQIYLVTVVALIVANIGRPRPDPAR